MNERPRADPAEVPLAETRRLRTFSVRALGIAAVWLGVFAGSILVPAGPGPASADNLLANGIPVPSVVVGVPDPARGTRSIRVSYSVGGITHTVDIARNSGRDYRPGEEVTVLYDPADRDRVRTPEETNENPFVTGVTGTAGLLSLVGAVASVVAAVGWRRRYRAVCRTGWRGASVTVVPAPRGVALRHLPDIHVEYRDGTRIRVRAANSCHGAAPMKNIPDRSAWVGGTGRDMVVLFPHGRWRTPPYAVPAHAKTPRGRSLSRARRSGSAGRSGRRR